MFFDTATEHNVTLCAYSHQNGFRWTQKIMKVTTIRAIIIIIVNVLAIEEVPVELAQQ